MSDLVAEITYHIEQSGMRDQVTLDVGVLEHWRHEHASMTEKVERLELYVGEEIAALLESE